jgi:uncharacterized SAM-binding protein YcdF (DUF218 family)
MTAAMLGRRGMVRPRRAMTLTVKVVVTAMLAWCAGFLWFLQVIGRPAALPAHADGVIALTGGAERVETALHLLADGRADRLLVSGTGINTELPTLGHLASVDTARLADRISLGRMAATTRGNALEAAAWVRKTGIHSLIVVTAYYHMPRALAELAPELRGVALFACPVGGDPAHRARFRLLAEEYTKYLVAASGVTSWLQSREPLLRVAGT